MLVYQRVLLKGDAVFLLEIPLETAHAAKIRSIFVYLDPPSIHKNELVCYPKGLSIFARLPFFDICCPSGTWTKYPLHTVFQLACDS